MAKKPFATARAAGVPANPVGEARAALEQAEKLRHAGKFDRARPILETLLKRHPDYVGALHTLGLVFADKGDHPRALPYLVRAAMLNPDDWTTQTALSGVYLHLGASVMAARTLEQARQRRPGNAAILATLGEIYKEGGEYELAADAYRGALAADRPLRLARMGLGVCCTHLGLFDEAAAAFVAMIGDGSRSVRMLYALAQLPVRQVPDDLLGLIGEARADAGMSTAECNTARLFARAAALDRNGDAGAAWRALADANATLLPAQRGAYLRDRAMRERVAERTRRNPLPKGPAVGDGAGPLSLFIIGPSRSGKTTLERLVGSLSAVNRGYEIPLVENVVKRVFRTAGLITRERVIEMPASLTPLFREFYREELERRAGAARMVTSTHPGRIFDVAGLAGVLPEARFVFMKRDRDDIALRIYMRNFSSGNAHACDLAAIREYVAWYEAMIDTLAEKLSARALVLDYQEMVADPQTTVARVARLCGLGDTAGPRLETGDDRGCARPYRDFMAGVVEG